MGNVAKAFSGSKSGFQKFWVDQRVSHFNKYFIQDCNEEIDEGYFLEVGI